MDLSDIGSKTYLPCNKESVLNSENYKLEIRNLGYFGIGEFKKLLKYKLKLDITKIKAPSGKEFAYICLRSEEEKKKALAILNGFKWKGRELKAFTSKSNQKPFPQSRDKIPFPKTDAKKKSVEQATCPLFPLTYAEQLKQKYQSIRDTIEKFKVSLKNVSDHAAQTLKSLTCEQIIPSPKIYEYRNKNEFTVGRNAAKEITVGFRLYRYSDGSVEVGDVQNLPHIPEAAKWAAKSFQEFLHKSIFLPFDPESNTGHVRQLMVRNSSYNSDIMIVVGIVTSNFTDEELRKFQLELVAFYRQFLPDNYKCTSLYYQDVKNREVGQNYNPVVHLCGNTHITDVILELQFRINPLSFFQVNTHCANVLYEKIIELAEVDKNTIVLDICCGTGTISLAFAKFCKQVYGVEIVDEAINDAKFNAHLNGVNNCRFFSGNCDDYIQTIVKEAVYNNPLGQPLEIVAVVDPPRAGLHSKSISSIRACSQINKLIYVSCDPNNAKKNWIDLGRSQSKQYKGRPFYPTKVVAIDMFPHTTHTEVVVVFKRADLAS